MSFLKCAHCGHIMKDGLETNGNNYFGSIVKNGEFHEVLHKAADVAYMGLSPVQGSLPARFLRRKEVRSPLYLDDKYK